jgi:hypothetical protein
MPSLSVAVRRPRNGDDPNSKATLTGDGVLTIRDDQLWIEDVAILELAERFGTPLYVLSERQRIACLTERSPRTSC